jgi:hypothetical protein
MFKRSLCFALTLLALFAAIFTPALADDASCTTDTNDGSGLPECGTPADNACYEGGVMEGKCVGDWEWKAGWHLARFLAGTMTREQVPQDFQIVLPPPAEPGDEPLRLCISETDGGLTIRGCLSSDQTGWIIVTDGIHTETIHVLFVDGDSSAACPLSHAGQPLADAGPTALVVEILVDAGIFTQEQVDTLRLMPVMCIYTDLLTRGGTINTGAAIQYANGM